MQVSRMIRQLVGVFFIVIACLYSQNSDALSLLPILSGVADAGSSLVQSLLPDLSILSSIQSLISLPFGLAWFLKQSKQYKQNDPRDTTPEQGEEYDFIVVGAGSAGAVVAGRLSEIYGLKILLLEAGGKESLIMGVPLLVDYLQFSNKINWKYQSEVSDSYCLGLEGQRCNMPRGKVMGGTSVLNYMVATRGNRRDYDRWAELGNEGWSWKDVLPYFKKMENIGVPELRSDAEMHSTKGPLAINYPVYHTVLATAFLEAGRELGYKILDYNGRNQTGFSYVQTTTANGSRVSSSEAYLVPARDRPNLSVCMHSLVSKILINKTDNRAIGVEFCKNNKKYTVRARKEVILCAGTIGSSQILMLSGIGPAQHLADIGIPLIKDAPVGKNLMDHITYGGLVVLINKPYSYLTIRIINPLNPYLSDYFNKRQGPLTVPGGIEAVAFVNVNASQDDSWPNMELLFGAGSMASDIGLRKVFGIKDSLWNEAYGKVTDKDAWTIMPMIMQPLSRGEILLKDGNIKTHPKIIPNYMSDPKDVETLINGIRAAKKIMESKSMAQFASKLYEAQLPGCKSHKYDSDGYWECALRTLTFNFYHYSGTAKMGPEGDPTAVVNPRLQVYGIKGLRVCDGSIIPEIPTGHTNIPIIMIGEKLSDMVKEDWGYATET